MFSHQWEESRRWQPEFFPLVFDLQPEYESMKKTWQTSAPLPLSKKLLPHPGRLFFSRFHPSSCLFPPPLYRFNKTTTSKLPAAWCGTQQPQSLVWIFASDSLRHTLVLSWRTWLELWKKSLCTVVKTVFLGFLVACLFLYSPSLWAVWSRLFYRLYEKSSQDSLNQWWNIWVFDVNLPYPISLIQSVNTVTAGCVKEPEI